MTVTLASAAILKAADPMMMFFLFVSGDFGILSILADEKVN